jgi:hypothetical protein
VRAALMTSSRAFGMVAQSFAIREIKERVIGWTTR